MKRGFKTDADRIACRLRQELGLPAHSPLPARKLLNHLKIPLLQPIEIPGLHPDIIHEVLNGSSEHWSAITFYDGSHQAHVIHNPKHAPTRQESDLMHETAHIECKHPPAAVVKVGGFDFRIFNQSHEEEANWLGGCLQITRAGLLWALSRGMSNEDIADHFGCSVAMARYRRNTSGVDLQLNRFHAARAR